MLLENAAVVKYQKVGHCRNSKYLNGAHRAGIVPVYALHATYRDGFSGRGDKFVEICLDCREIFSEHIFEPGKALRRIIDHGC